MDPAGRWRLPTVSTGRRAAVVAVSACFAVLISITLAKLVWVVVDGPRAAVEPAQPAPVASTPVVQRFAPDVAASWNVFGDAVASASPAGQDEDAPATRLSLQLLGVFSSGDKRLAGAVIAERGKDGDLFRIGTTVPGGATLEKVDADKVTLRRRGQLETLSFDKPEATGGDGAPLPGAGLDMAAGFRNVSDRMMPVMDGNADDGTDSQSRARAAIARFADDIRADPEGVLSQLGMRAVQPGQSSGYVVGDGVSGDALKSMGLRPGDVVMSVNGKPIGNVRNDSRMVDEVRASGEARVEIRRGSQTFTVNYPL